MKIGYLFLPLLLVFFLIAEEKGTQQQSSLPLPKKEQPKEKQMETALTPALPPKPPSLRERIRKARHPKSKVFFHSPPRPFLKVGERAAQILTAQAEQCDMEKISQANRHLASYAMEIIIHDEKQQRFLIIQEKEGSYRGSGVYVLRCGKALPLVIQAPHSYFDLNTAGISYKIFRESKARWLMTNSLHRYRSYENESADNSFHPADVAHNPNSLFQAIVKGIFSVAPKLIFLQFHGFDSAWRNTDVVLSDGHLQNQIWSQKLKQYWQPLNFKVMIFGTEIQDLGGTSNSQSRFLKANGGHFLHVEMSGALRKKLVRKKAFRKPLLTALEQIIQPVTEGIVGP